MNPPRPGSIVDSARRIGGLAWPVLVGQVAVLAFGTIDTVLLARLGAQDLAALSVGSAAYITVFVGLMGVLLAIGPIVGRLHGAREAEAAGRQFQQGLWLALFLSVPGCAVLAFPAPFLALAKADLQLAEGVRGYMGSIAVALPAALLFTVYRGFNTAISRPKAVMVLQVAGLALKVPLSIALAWGVPALGLPRLGVEGCGMATAVVMWLQCAGAAMLMARDPAYAPYRLRDHRWPGPDLGLIAAHLRLGIPMGAGVLVEVTGFTFMAILIARLGAEAVAGHQIAANIVALLFMVALSLSNAASTLVAQRLGAHDDEDAQRLAWHAVALGAGVALVMAGAVHLWRREVVGLYTRDQQVIAAALPMVAWVLVFHVADAIQTVCALVLRAYHVATLPVVIYAVALWGLGLGGGWVLAHGGWWGLPPAGAPGYWLAASMALALAAVLLLSLMAWVITQETRRARAEAATR